MWILEISTPEFKHWGRKHEVLKSKHATEQDATMALYQWVKDHWSDYLPETGPDRTLDEDGRMLYPAIGDILADEAIERYFEAFQDNGAGSAIYQEEHIQRLIDPMDPKDIAMGMTVTLAVMSIRKGIHSRQEMEGHIADGYKIMKLTVSASEYLDKVISMGILVQIGDQITLSQRGKLMCSVLSKKLAVADLVGENTVRIDQEDIKQFKEASEDLPG